MRRMLLLTLIWLMAAIACACVVVPLWFAALGQWPEWRRQSGTRTYIWGLSGEHFYVIRIDRPPDNARVAGETGIVSMGHILEERSFVFGHWTHIYRDVFYSTAPNETYDPSDPNDQQKLSTYRRAIEHDRKIVFLHTWRCAALFGFVPAIVLVRWGRRYLRRRREFLLDHCRICGYDLRATPNRCPECGARAATAT